MHKDSILSKFLYEPLFHFLLIGIGIFFLFLQLNTNEDTSDTKRIIISQSKIQALSIAFLRERGRAPTANEMQNLLDSEIREEVLSREALAMGLDKEDVLIRRRLAQKMQYLFEDIAVVEEPSDADLQEFLQLHPSKFTLPITLSFSQVYLDPKLHENVLEEEMKSLLENLNKTSVQEALSLGDRSLLEYNFSNRRQSDVLRTFGDSFSQKIFEVPMHSWEGPFQSAYGIHFVYIHSRDEAVLAPLNQIKESVKQEYKRIKQVQANELFYKRLKGRYEIKVDDDVIKTANISAS